MAETVNTSALLLSDGQGGYSKAFVESMSDIVKLSDGSTLTEKLTEIDGKLPITLESGSLPETLNSEQIGISGNDIYIKANDVVTFYTNKNIVAQTSDPGAGSALATGRIVLVYE